MAAIEVDSVGRESVLPLLLEFEASCVEFVSNMYSVETEMLSQKFHNVGCETRVEKQQVDMVAAIVKCFFLKSAPPPVTNMCSWWVSLKDDRGRPVLI
jgi:hypothetical protein